MVSTAVLLSACGSGGSTISTPTVNKSSFNLTGSVPGTLIETFCEDGSYYSISSIKNGTSKHPFSLVLPTNLSCRLVMTTNEDDPLNKIVTPIKFVNNKGISSIAFSAKEDVDLDFVDLALRREDMHSDYNGDGVEDVPKEILLSDASASKLKIIISANDPLDDDNDGIINVYEDDDGDKIPNKDDEDDDGDGVLDTEDNDHNNDTDGDGIKNDDDKDDDNDGKDDDEDSNDDDVDSNDNDEDSNDDDVDSNDDDNNGNGGGVPTGSVITTPSAARLLASQCAQCHGTDGASVTDLDSLVGESRGEIIEEMLEMQDENKNELMHLQAKGYDSEQIGLIADYFSSLSDGENSDNVEDDEEDDEND